MCLQQCTHVALIASDVLVVALNVCAMQVSHPLWYFTSALPRMLLISLPLALIGAVTNKYVIADPCDRLVCWCVCPVCYLMQVGD